MSVLALTLVSSFSGSHIFDHGILRILLKRKRTVIMSCNRQDFLQRADSILYFDETDQLQYQGTYPELKRRHPEWLDGLRNDSKSLEGKTAQERWKLLRNVTKLSLGMRPKETNPSTNALPKCSRPFKRLESSAHLGFCHNFMLQNPTLEEESESTLTLLRRARSTRMSPVKNLAKMAIHNEHRRNMAESPSSPPRFTAQDSMIGLHFAHKFVSRMTSNTSQMSAISGFSDDQDEDFEQDGLMTHHDGSWEEEERGRGRLQYKVILSYFKAGGGINLLLFIVFSIAFQSTKIYTDCLLKRRDESLVTTYMSWCGLALLLSMLANVIGQNLGASARRTLHERLLRHLMRVTPGLFDVLPASRFISRLAQDTFVIDQKLPSCLQRMALVTFICLGALAVNVIQSPIFLAFATPLLLFYWAIQHFYRRSSIELQRIESSTRSPSLSHLSNTLRSLVSLRAFGEETRLTNQYCDFLDANTTAMLLLQSGSRWLAVSLDMAGSVIVFASVLSCLLNRNGRASDESFALALNYSLLIPIYLAWVIKFYTELEHCLNAVERVQEYTVLEQEESSPSLTETPNHFDMTFDNVSLSHGDVLRPDVHHLTFHLPTGQIVAIVGRSGSGKSTIVGSLSGLCRIVEGRILIGGISISDIPWSYLRRQVRFVPQDIHVFAGKTRNILDPEGKLADSEIKKMLAQLDIKNVDLEETVDPFGENLAASQKQELVIAQALLGHPRILVLDEATSALEDDKLLSAKLIKVCRNLNVTLVSVIHRLSNITSYDRILVVGDGRLLEDGNPAELLKKPMGFFSSLYRNSH